MIDYYSREDNRKHCMFILYRIKKAQQYDLKMHVQSVSSTGQWLQLQQIVSRRQIMRENNQQQFVMEA